jgi:hypothetical protein
MKLASTAVGVYLDSCDYLETGPQGYGLGLRDAAYGIVVCEGDDAEVEV